MSFEGFVIIIQPLARFGGFGAGALLGKEGSGPLGKRLLQHILDILLHPVRAARPHLLFDFIVHEREMPAHKLLHSAPIRAALSPLCHDASPISAT
ncbi:hypothetical protein D3C72_1849170 [compost metagenome]